MTPPDPAGLDSFRAQARRWIVDNLDPEYVTTSAEEQASHNRELQRRLYAAGLAGLTVPVRYGGRGLGPQYERVFSEEVARHGVPRRLQGIGTCLPTLLAHADETLKLRHIAAMLRGDEVWVQLQSEPAAGADLAGLLTTATRDRDGFVLRERRRGSTEPSSLTTAPAWPVRIHPW